ncbi:MAG: L-threonylcarbamoyladenylate synthase [Actinobacteria bacterium]|nr:L-threonylcarbamoyladenylate synthase [Actinomycetota bacterium]
MKQISTDVTLAASVLRDGGVIGLPTETVYGLAARVDHETAIARVFAIKQRPLSHPLIVHAYGAEQCDEWGVLSPIAQVLAQAFWPGPLTILVYRTSQISDQITGGRDTVALRVPEHPLARQLIQELGVPVVAPSANRFGRVSPTTAQHVLRDLGHDVDLILDGGACTIGVESTIIDCTSDTPQLLRPGALTTTQITQVTGLVVSPATGPSRSAGMLEHHYAPQCRVELFENNETAQAALLQVRQSGQRGSIIDYGVDLAAYAHRLYHDLRECDNDGIDVALCVLPPPEGLGIAIRDRLLKAASD